MNYGKVSKYPKVKKFLEETDMSLEQAVIWTEKEVEEMEKRKKAEVELKKLPRSFQRFTKLVKEVNSEEKQLTPQEDKKMDFTKYKDVHDFKEKTGMDTITAFDFLFSFLVKDFQFLVKEVDRLEKKLEELKKEKIEQSNLIKIPTKAMIEFREMYCPDLDFSDPKFFYRVLKEISISRKEVNRLKKEV